MAGSGNIGLGLLLIVAGLGLTAFSYAGAASKGGGNYFIYHGLVICGVVQLFRGLSGGGPIRAFDDRRSIPAASSPFSTGCFLDRMVIMKNRGGAPDPTSPAPQGFQTTRWSLVMAARDGRTAVAREALTALCETYWYPLYAFVRRKGHDADEALDLVQGFFARLLERGDLASVDRSKGRLRSFLMAACTHYLANRRDHDRAEKRGGGRRLVSIDRTTAEGRYGREPSHEQTAERLFEQRWATTLLDLVVGRLEEEMTAAGKARQFADPAAGALGRLGAGILRPDRRRAGRLERRRARRRAPPPRAIPRADPRGDRPHPRRSRRRRGRDPFALLRPRRMKKSGPARHGPARFASLRGRRGLGTRRPGP